MICSKYKGAAVDPLIAAADFAEPHHPSLHPPWPTWTGINSERRVLAQEDSAKNVRRYGEHALLGTLPRCAWLRVTGHKFSTLRPRHHLRLPDLGWTVKRLAMKRESHCLTGTNAKLRWIPTEASFTIPQVRHRPLTVTPIQCAPDETECSYQTIAV